jgi:hypothetical protein
MSESGLAEEMRASAATITKVNAHYRMSSDAPWRPSCLLKEAEHVEAEEHEAADRERLVANLAQELFRAFNPKCKWSTDHILMSKWYDAARALLESGWRNGGPA